MYAMRMLLIKLSYNVVIIDGIMTFHCEVCTGAP